MVAQAELPNVDVCLILRHVQRLLVVSSKYLGIHTLLNQLAQTYRRECVREHQYSSRSWCHQIGCIVDHGSNGNTDVGLVEDDVGLLLQLLNEVKDLIPIVDDVEEEFLFG